MTDRHTALCAEVVRGQALFARRAAVRDPLFNPSEVFVAYLNVKAGAKSPSDITDAINTDAINQGQTLGLEQYTARAEGDEEGFQSPRRAS